MKASSRSTSSAPQIFGDGGGRELCRHLTLPLGADCIQHSGVLPAPHRRQRGEVGVLEEGVEGRAHLGSGEAVL